MHRPLLRDRPRPEGVAVDAVVDPRPVHSRRTPIAPATSAAVTRLLQMTPRRRLDRLPLPRARDSSVPAGGRRDRTTSARDTGDRRDRAQRGGSAPRSGTPAIGVAAVGNQSARCPCQVAAPAAPGGSASQQRLTKPVSPERARQRPYRDTLDRLRQSRRSTRWVDQVHRHRRASGARYDARGSWPVHAAVRHEVARDERARAHARVDAVARRPTPCRAPARNRAESRSA